ncbi:MAG: exodeoxyribonuclease VII large subunit [Flavobacteriia bacterium]|nr:exodeoxyribonuclease VII large subunit [Flavobacteriia bacterium]
MSTPLRKGHSLSKVLSRVQQVFEEQISPHEVWVKAEISSYRKHASGHHYLDFVEERNQSIVARCKANLWRGQADIIEARTGLDLSKLMEDGRELLCLCRLVFHPVFGLSLHVTDIDPNFTLGEIEKRRQETIAKLKKLSLLHLNRQLRLPRVIQNIAIIAAEGSAGLADLQNQLETNSYGFKFNWTHFNALVQGAGSPSSILKVYESIPLSEYDAVVLIRGGGSALDLDAFNDFELNRVLAESKLPFLVGIGHETDRTVIDEWAAKSLKTPSAVGAWIVERARDYEVAISTAYQGIMELYRAQIESAKASSQERLNQIVHYSRSNLNETLHDLESMSRGLSMLYERYSNTKRERLAQISNSISRLSKEQLVDRKHEMQDLGHSLDRYATEITVRAKSHLDLVEKLVDVYHPQSTLKRGYSYLRKGKLIVTSGDALVKNDMIEIITEAHEIEAVVQKIKEKDA